MLAFVCDDLKETTEVLSERGGGEMWSEKEPLTVQQGVLKAALLDSEGLDYAVWDGRGDDRNDFLDWIVRQVEHRVAPDDESCRDVVDDSAASVKDGRMVLKLASVGLDVSTPLTSRQTELKKAFLNSDVAELVNLGSLTTELEHDFIVWVVRQVEHRVDLSMDNRPLPSEVDWRYYPSNLSRLAVYSGLHVDVATAVLDQLADQLDLTAAGEETTPSSPYDWCSEVDWVYWTVELSKLALQRGIHEKYARECV